MEELEFWPRRFSRNQHERFDLIRMTTRRLDGKVDSKCSCASDADDIATDAELRHQKFIRRILRCLPSLVLFVSLQINGEGIDSSGDQLLSNVVPRLRVRSL